MDPSRRSKLREELRADAGRLAALAERHGTPLLVLQPHLVARRYRQLTARLAGFRLHYAVKASPHPVVLSTIAICGGGFDVATSAEVDPSAAARPADGPLHPHQSDQEARGHRRTPTRRASARSSSRILARHRNSRAGRPTSSCWCGWRSAIRPPSPTCRRSSASSRPTPNCSSSTSSPRVSQFAGLQLPRRQPGLVGSSRTARRCAARWT